MATIGAIAKSIGLDDRDGERAVLMTLTHSGKVRNVYLSDVADTEITPEIPALYGASGLFKDGALIGNEGRSRENLTRVLWLPFDADLLDYLGHEPSPDPGKKHERERALDELGGMPQDELNELIGALRADLEETFAALGLPIHRLDYTGYGLCAYVYLTADDQLRVEDARDAHKIVVKAINDRYGHQLIDKQCTDAGTRVTRIPESYNHKGAIPRLVQTLIPYTGETYPLGQRPSAAKPMGQWIPREGDGLAQTDVSALIEAVAPSWTMGQKHAVSLALAGMMAKAGIPESQALAIVEHLAASDNKPYDRRRTVESSYARTRAGGLVQGYLSLRDRIPGNALEIVDGILARYRRSVHGSVTVGPLSGEVTRKARKKGEAAAFAPTPIPDAAVVGWFRDYLDLVEPTTEAPDAFHIACGMTMIGACIGRRIALYHASERIYPNLFTLLIGPSGRARKDTSIKRSLRLPQLPPPPGAPLVALGAPFAVRRDVSSAEGLIRVLSKNPNMLLYMTEFAKLMHNATRESTASISPTLMDAFDTPSVITNTVRNEENSLEARNPFLSILSGVQPEILSELIGNQQQYSGFLNRWLLIVGDGKGARPAPPNLDEGSGWSLMKRAMDAIQSYPEGSVLQLDESAIARWEAWYIASYPNGNTSSKEDAMGIRLGTLAMKAALIHAVLARSPAVQVSHLDAATSLVDWSWRHTRKLLPTWGEAPEARIERLIIETLSRKGPMTRRNVQRAMGHRTGPGVFGRVVKAMVENGEVVETTERVLVLVPEEDETA